MIIKFINSFKTIGIKKTIIKSINYVSIKNYKRRKLKKKIFNIQSIENRFNEIYQSNFWLGQSKSGTGSVLSTTQNIRKHLPIIFEKFSIKKVLDAPCGDFNWMFEVIKNYEVDYIGSDIVEDIIFLNKKKYENKNIQFSKLDIRVDKLPEADLMICRDCLFHFSYEDIFLFLKNFISSDIKFILLTSHLNEKNKFANIDISTGDFRSIDLFLKPFNFKKIFLYNFDDRENEKQNYKQMYLFSKLQIYDYLKKNKNYLENYNI